MSHTPGPWVQNAAHVFSPGAKRLVASMCEPDPPSDFVGYHELSVTSKNLGEAFANAALISAAPELYAALNLALEYVEHDVEGWCDIDRLVPDEVGSGRIESERSREARKLRDVLNAAKAKAEGK